MAECQICLSRCRGAGELEPRRCLMKFTYVDESGSEGHTDVFVMAGLLIDAYRLRKYTSQFDAMIAAFLAKHPGAPKELKTSAFINGNGGWSKVKADDRKAFLRSVCDLAIECATLFASAFSFENFRRAAAGRYGQPFGTSYWLAASMYIAALIQKKMQEESNNKGLTVLICDDNKVEMSNLSDLLYEAHAWFDPIYQRRRTKGGKRSWVDTKEEERFDQIINSAFAIKSEHCSLVQVSDAVAYVSRRHLELKTDKEAWPGEREFYGDLFGKLAPRRVHLGQNPGGSCIEFYTAACHSEWGL